MSETKEIENVKAEEKPDSTATATTAPPVAEPAKPEKAKKRGESPEEIAKLLTMIEKAEKEVQEAEIELNTRKEAAKTAKANWMTKVQDLRNMVRTREKWKQEAKRQPLLNQKKQKDALAGKSGAINADWRKLGIDKMQGKVTEKDRDKLGAKGLYTLGDVQDLMTKHGTWWFKEVTGVGRAAADRIEAEFNKIVMANTPDEPATEAAAAESTTPVNDIGGINVEAMGGEPAMA